jgi:hypothetical protein
MAAPEATGLLHTSSTLLAYNLCALHKQTRNWIRKEAKRITLLYVTPALIRKTSAYCLDSIFK